MGAGTAGRCLAERHGGTFWSIDGRSNGSRLRRLQSFLVSGAVVEGYTR
jgi:hypothetical protein